MIDRLLETTALHGVMDENNEGSKQSHAEHSSELNDASSNSKTQDTDPNTPVIAEVSYLFHKFISGTEMTKGLRVQFAPQFNPLFAGNWVTVDLGQLEVIAREAGTVTLDFEDDYFDKVLCTDLNRISRPASLVGELRRVLKRRGQIWTQAPLSVPGDSGSSEQTLSYWYFTPEGFQVLFETFDEIVCSIYQDDSGNAPRESYFYGIKPEIASDDQPPPPISMFPI